MHHQLETILIQRLPLEVEISRVLTSQGVPFDAQSRLDERIVEVHRQVVREVLARAKARASASLLPVRIIDGMVLAAGRSFRASEVVREGLARVDEACFLVCTLGREVDTHIASLISRRETSRAWTAETAASYALSGACTAATKRLAARFRWRGRVAVVAPGEDGWDLQEQAEIVTLAGGEAIHVEVAAAGVLRPSKSVTAVLFQPIGSLASCGNSRCSRCGRREQCSFRFSDNQPDMVPGEHG